MFAKQIGNCWRLKALLLAPVLALAAGLVYAAAPAEASGGHGHPTVTRETVRSHELVQWLFTINGDICPDVPGHAGNIDPTSSHRVTTTTTITWDDGRVRTIIEDVVTGMARDDEPGDHFGDVYRFRYENTAVIDTDAAHPDVVAVFMKDLFTLRGKGVNLYVAFRWAWKFDASLGFAFPSDPGTPDNPDTYDERYFFTKGHPNGCDPI
jgi:hypothetical protein